MTKLRQCNRLMSDQEELDPGRPARIMATRYQAEVARINPTKAGTVTGDMVKRSCRMAATMFHSIQAKRQIKSSLSQASIRRESASRRGRFSSVTRIGYLKVAGNSAPAVISR